MAVYTYVRNRDPDDKTGEIVLRGGALTIKMGEWADITVPEYNSLINRFDLQLGELGPPAPPPSKSFLRLIDLADVPTPSASEDGKVPAWDEATREFIWSIITGGGGGGGGPPSGPAGGILAGTYPNPAFAVDMATQTELNTVQSGVDAVQAEIDDLIASGGGPTQKSTANLPAGSGTTSATPNTSTQARPAGSKLEWGIKNLSTDPTIPIYLGLGAAAVAGGGPTIFPADPEYVNYSFTGAVNVASPGASIPYSLFEV